MRSVRLVPRRRRKEQIKLKFLCPFCEYHTHGTAFADEVLVERPRGREAAGLSGAAAHLTPDLQTVRRVMLNPASERSAEMGLV